MDGAVNTAAAQERGVRGVGNGIHTVVSGDVTLNTDKFGTHERKLLSMFRT